MRYNGYSGYDEENYSEYGRRGMRGTGPYSRYRGGRGSGRYRGEDAIDEMQEHYMNYNEGREQYNRGNYNGGEQEMIQSTEGIMSSVVDIVRELSESQNPEVMQIIKRSAKEIMEMR